MESSETQLPDGFEPIAVLFSKLNGAIESAAKGRMVGLLPITIKLPVSEPPIHAFYTSVSWLYVLLTECGPVHFRFLAERAMALGLDGSGELDQFRNDVQILRTVLQHNLNLSYADDLAKLVRCETWMSQVLGKTTLSGDRFWPNTDSEWRRLATELRARARHYCETSISTVRRILKDEFAEDVIREWTMRHSRSLPAHEFDSIVSQAAADLGLKHLDVVRVRKVHLDEWNRRVRLLGDGADIKREARRLVEQTLLIEAEDYLPITGEEVIELLGVKPGPMVGKTLKQARELYRSSPCSREELVEKLKSKK